MAQGPGERPWDQRARSPPSGKSGLGQNIQFACRDVTHTLALHRCLRCRDVHLPPPPLTTTTSTTNTNTTTATTTTTMLLLLCVVPQVREPKPT